MTGWCLSGFRRLTDQARPNVLFELGLAFGKYPSRTIIIEFGRTRMISDLPGRNVVRFSNTAQSRHDIVGRLRTAGCSPDTDHKSDWLHQGKFDYKGADLPPSIADLHDQFKAAVAAKEKAEQERDHLKHENDSLNARIAKRKIRTI